MTNNFRITAVFSVLMFLIALQSLGQNRYLHLRGSIESEEKVSADLVIAGEKVYGFIQNHFTREAPVGVSGSLLEGGIINLIDKTTDNELIAATMTENGLITGKWKNNSGEERPFEMTVVNADENVQFNVSAVSSMQSLVETPDSPIAVFESSVLSPSNPQNKSVHENFMTLIYKEFYKSSDITDPMVLLKSHENTFFEKYRMSNTDINTKENYQFLNWEKRRILSIVLNESDLVGFNFRDYTYTGGTSGLEINKYLVFDFSKGSRVSIYDIVQKEKEAELKNLIRAELCRNLSIDPSDLLTNHGFFDNDVYVTANFTLTYYGIVFQYNTYELAGQETGPVSVFLSFDNLKEVILREGIIERILE